LKTTETGGGSEEKWGQMGTDGENEENLEKGERKVRKLS
jgi:hypothetical protein